jgi:hypothetical protein
MKNKLYLYLISQNVNNDYDTYDSAVVVAPNPKSAKLIHPCSDYVLSELDWTKDCTWCPSPNDVNVKCIGVASRGQKVGVVLSSYNAG